MTDANEIALRQARLRAYRATQLVTQVEGLSEATARNKINRAGCRSRVVYYDHDPAIVTQDVRFDRVNLRLMDGKVIGAYVG